MKKLALLLIMILTFQNCASNSLLNNGLNSGVSIQKIDGASWELKVNEAQFDSFLTSEARAKSMYTEQYLKSKNTFLVQEWNSYYHSKSFPNVIESTIDYSPSEKYGLDFEYKLYQFFAMLNSKHGIPFNNLGQMDKRR